MFRQLAIRDARPTRIERGEDRPDIRESIVAPWTLDVHRVSRVVETCTLGRWALGVECRLLAALLCFITAPLIARTVTLKPEALDAFATLSEHFPRNGWAANQYSATLTLSNPPVTVPTTSYLLRYSLDQIPKGQRITHAEWVIAGSTSAVTSVQVWRVLAEWGIGVCHQYRMVYPKKLEWSVAGARGKSIDRATNATGSGKFGKGATEITVNVTQDVELWYSGAAPNRGWLLTFDSYSILISPTHTAERSKWELRVTYEPE